MLRLLLPVFLLLDSVYGIPCSPPAGYTRSDPLQPGSLFKIYSHELKGYDDAQTQCLADHADATLATLPHIADIKELKTGEN